MTRQRGTVRIGIDVGGTFTDVVALWDDTGEVAYAKVQTTPTDQSAGFLDGLLAIVRSAGVEPARVRDVVHGSTVATNAVLEGRGARLGLLTTAGFRHILEIGRAYIPGLFTNYVTWQRPPRLVPLERVREVPERVGPHGEVERPLDEAAARAAIDALLAQGVEAIAVSLLHSYANDAHERRLAHLIEAARPGSYVSLSSAVLPEYREYERTMTAVMNAYVMPVMTRYIERLRSRLAEAGFDAPLHVMRSDAGLMSPTATLERPVNTLLSGPAGGVSAAGYLAGQAGAAGPGGIITLDMGGTSTDVGLNAVGEPRLRTETVVGSYPVKIPIVDLTTIGAGGGSIAWVADTGGLRVGPQSAGATPGPAAYGLGGIAPTVTDANLVLGRLPSSLAGDTVRLRPDLASSAIEALGKRINLDVVAAAWGIVRVANQAMLGAIRIVSVERGYDPADFTLVAFGGAGPLHGAELAELAGINHVLVPEAPGVLSALGFLIADARQVFTRTLVSEATSRPPPEALTLLGRLTAAATRWLADEGVSPECRETVSTVDLRYQGQASEVTVSLQTPVNQASWASSVAAFHREHERLFGFAHSAVAVELVTLRVTAVGRTPKSRPRVVEAATPVAPAPVGRRPVHFSGFVTTPIFSRELLRHGQTLIGPAVIEQADCTTVVPPGWTATVDAYRNLRLSRGKATSD